MALFKVLKGNEENLKKQELHDGFAYFTSDTNNFYIDHEIEAADPTGEPVVKRSLSGVGKNTLEGGEIFSDYENNKAEGEGSHAGGKNVRAYGEAAFAQGKGNVAGCKGYYWKAIKVNEKD